MGAGAGAQKTYNINTAESGTGETPPALTVVAPPSFEELSKEKLLELSDACKTFSKFGLKSITNIPDWVALIEEQIAFIDKRQKQPPQQPKQQSKPEPNHAISTTRPAASQNAAVFRLAGPSAADTQSKNMCTTYGIGATTASSPQQQPQQQPRALCSQACDSQGWLLSEKNVLIDELSDHMPQVFICGAMSEKVRVLTWNIMTQCRNTTFCNNGFGKNEFDTDYNARLKRIASEVANFFRQNNTGLPMVAALQECPVNDGCKKAFIRGIQEALPKSIKIEYRERPTSRTLANFTLWDASQWESRYVPQRNNGLLARALITDLLPVRGAARSSLRFINVHFEWKAKRDLGDHVYNKHVAHVADTVRTFLVQDGLVVLAGDFNMNVVDTKGTFSKDRRVVIDQMCDSSWTWQDNNRVPNTVDGIIWSD